MSQICLPLGLQKDDLEKLEELIQTSSTIQSGEHIYHQGDPFKKVFAVKAGTIKSTRVDEFGNQHVVDFHLPGELVGLDGIYPTKYLSAATALDTVVVCSMDYDNLTELCTTIPALQRQLLRLLSRDIYESHITQSDNAEQTAEQKLAAFLHNLSARYELRGYSATEFILTMSRQDIASHIGVAPETVSRLLKRFKQSNIIEIENRHISILDVSHLGSIINCKAA